MKYHFSRDLRDSDRAQLYRALDFFNIAAYFKTVADQEELFGFGSQQEADVPNKLNGNIIFGGYPFDEQVVQSSKLMNGIWFIPLIFVKITRNIIIFESDTVDNFNEWLTKFKVIPISKVASHVITSELDWTLRTQKLINTIISNDKLKKVVLGRQHQYALSDTLLASALVHALITQKNTYHVILKYQQEMFVSATPECLVKVTDGQVKTAAVAGTIRRGNTQTEDKLLGDALLNSHKNQQEHRYVVNNIYQKLQNMTTNLYLPSQPILLQNRQLQHLYTPISANLIKEYTVLDVVNALHPTPALGGVPQEEALHYIKVHERLPRGLFAAPIGYYTSNNSGEFVVGIRSMYINQVAHTATLFAGAGIVSDSNATQEYQETNLKLEPMRQLLKGDVNDN
ncbi:MAG: isochorismate synthase [Leuconostoc gelidum]|jgi:menaquinone-specific isochorismate synthase|uniref:isochorismate synthase n=1 Tax=Leuconostoc gelidum TaxID=1244 RepID=UPI0015764E20|nr:isochorismate synthase [Leuconostoc gelidum]MBZ5978231.1 isochorismate synthase [Leuconostoc gelidum subsp. gelidum]QDJ29941.1 isochorismate synthase [Leuconostoc gelidum subsp. gelidum]